MVQLAKSSTLPCCTHRFSFGEGISYVAGYLLHPAFPTSASVAGAVRSSRNRAAPVGGGPSEAVPMHARCLPPSSTPPSALHASFLAILPQLQRHGRIYFRGARSDRKADLVARWWPWPGSGS